MLRRTFATGLGLLAVTRAARADDATLLRFAENAVTANDARRRTAIEGLLASGRRDVVPALIDLMLFYTDDSDLIAAGLRRLTGQNIATDWHSWMLWQEGEPQPRPFSGYDTFKARLLYEVDPAFVDFLHPSLP